MIEAAALLTQCSFWGSAGKVLDWAVASAQEAEPEFRLYLAQLKDDQDGLQTRIIVLSRLLIDSPHLASRQTLALFFPKAFLLSLRKTLQV